MVQKPLWLQQFGGFSRRDPRRPARARGADNQAGSVAMCGRMGELPVHGGQARGPGEPVSLRTAGAGNAVRARKLTDYTKTDQRVRGERSLSQPGQRAPVSRICEGVKRNFSESIVAHLRSSANEEDEIISAAGNVFVGSRVSLCPLPIGK